MYKIYIILPILILAFSTAIAQNTLTLEKGQSPPAASIQDVAWIAGHWRGEAFGGITEEIWSPPMGKSMMCVFRMIKDDKVSFYEIVTITEKNESLILRLKHFYADLKGWEEKDETIDFPLVKIAHNKAYFDGFTFERISDKELNIYVVVEQKEDTKEEVKFPYQLLE